MKIISKTDNFITITIWNVDNSSTFVWTCDSETAQENYLDKMVPNLSSKNRITIETKKITTYQP